ncbi:MAG: exodeoxyribonuclease VII small subunit [Saprospiraceae bacterium]|nr:exodeoxyribonuclease VII small subunit [Saprospiraceae bacterium]
MAKKKTTDELTYDSAMHELQKIVAQLQNDSIGIDDLAENVKRASELILFCREKLRTTETDLNSILTVS